jgi:hypothetical protein
MNIATKLSLQRSTITLRDLVQPNLNKREERAIKRALKNAKKDQESLRAKAQQS